VPGGGEPGSTHTRTYDFEMPESGHIVAAGGHVHGGGKNLEISQPGCGNRRLMRMDPAWGMAEHPFYNVRPILHEPGPIAVSAYFSSQGFPVAKGESIKLTSNYDNVLPHTRVMGISLVYVAPSSEPVNACGPLPSDVQRVQTGQPFRSKPPRFTVPLVGIGPNGNARDISRPPGKTVALKSGAKIGVRDYFFSRPNVRVKRGAKLNWLFNGKADVHNVTLASGPRGFGSPNRKAGRFSYRFRAKGKYKIFCALHPVSMTEVVTVR
jgi:plastocyanin